ncbi:hypothetical protein CB1_001418003 [Camelus ferus]|nr:hypothetical protein CB1_001418003 [Camelus ferus]
MLLRLDLRIKLSCDQIKKRIGMGKGPLKHTTDVIYAAKMISESGSRMDVLARQIANQCPDPSCKQDLLAYLEQIKFYSHQLKICSQVKAEIQSLGGELIMSAVHVD